MWTEPREHGADSQVMGYSVIWGKSDCVVKGMRTDMKSVNSWLCCLVIKLGSEVIPKSKQGQSRRQ